MKPIAIILLLLCGPIGAFAHGGHLATFTYQVEASQIQLQFKIERVVLHHFDLQSECAHFEAASALCILQHLNANSWLKWNGQTIDFELLDASQDEHFFTLNLIAKGDFSAEADIQIKNRCFLKYDARFENRIIFQNQDTLTSYRLNTKNDELLLPKD